MVLIEMEFSIHYNISNIINIKVSQIIHLIHNHPLFYKEDALRVRDAKYTFWSTKSYFNKYYSESGCCVPAFISYWSGVQKYA